jgi:hypothetical protein
LALSYTHNMDAVCDRENANTTPLERRALIGGDPCNKTVMFGDDTPGVTVWRDLAIDTVQATLTQNVTPTLVAQAGLYGQIIRGFQSNPYRRVRVNGIEAQEHVPNVRARTSLTLRMNKYFSSLRSALHASVRGYTDTWGVESVTLDMGWSQYMGSHLLMRFRVRTYQQDSAAFFKDAFFYETEGTAGEYFTGDRELGPLRHIVPGAKITYLAFDEEGGDVWGLFDEVRINLKGDILFYDELNASNAELNPEGTDRQFLTAGQFFDGFQLQLSILTTY